VPELHFSPRRKRGASGRSVRTSPTTMWAGRGVPFFHSITCHCASRRTLLDDFSTSAAIRSWQCPLRGNSRKHLLVARFSRFDPNQTWRFRVSPQMSSGVFSRIASTSTVIWRGRTVVLSRLHVGARLARAAHLPPIQHCHLLFDPSTEGLHMRVLPPALWADEVIGPARAQGEPNWHHESPRA
jgi:hypothetical protein